MKKMSSLISIHVENKSSPWTCCKFRILESSHRIFPFPPTKQTQNTYQWKKLGFFYFNWVGKVRGFKHDQFTYTTMLDIFGEAGRVSSMKYLFQQMQEKGLKILFENEGQKMFSHCCFVYSLYERFV
ncbi:hypothetical protein GQ457_04G035430 [Hibiscus cannabinus]